MNDLIIGAYYIYFTIDDKDLCIIKLRDINICGECIVDLYRVNRGYRRGQFWVQALKTGTLINTDTLLNKYKKEIDLLNNYIQNKDME